MKIDPATRLGYNFGLGFFSSIIVTYGIFLLVKKAYIFLYLKFFAVTGIRI